MLKAPLTAALIGLGNIAWRFDERSAVRGVDCLTHARAYLQNSRTRLAGGCSPDPLDRKEFKNTFSLPAYETIDEMLERLRPDVVSICSPSDYHFNHALRCLDAGTPMLWLEKPPTLTLRELDRLSQIEKERSATVLVGYMRRLGTQFGFLRDYLAHRELGEIQGINISYSRGLALNGSHFLDLAFFLTGDDPAWEILYACPGRQADHPSFGLRLADGTQLHVQGYPLPYHAVDMSITCTEGRISVLSGGLETRLERVHENELFPGFFRLRETEPPFPPRHPLDGLMTGSLDELLAAHSQARRPLSNLETSRLVMAVLDEVAARTGGAP